MTQESGGKSHRRQADDKFKGRDLLFDAKDLFHEITVSGNNGFCAAVMKNKGKLSVGAGGIDGHADAAGALDGLIRYDPAGPVVGKQTDPIIFFNPHFNQPGP
jgi:hypothetical protein